MKLPISWLNEFVSVEDLSIEELENKFLNIGFEVEERIYFGNNIDKVVVGEIISIKNNENSDKLKICEIDIDTEKHLIIVTGASNIKVGDRIPVALDGATLPDKHITACALRGVMSYGMMCSGAELGIDNNIIEGAEENGILILPKNAELGMDIKKYLGLDEYILDISVTANRPDCQSIYGLAREIAVALHRKVKRPDIKYKAEKIQPSRLPEVYIDAPELCSRYTGNIITDVKLDKSPYWMRKRLLMCGIRPKNNAVDITNYVLLEVGQPLHAFDISCIEGNIHARRAAKDESIIALNGESYNLSKDMLVISDDKKPLAIAGVMGGEYSGINNATKEIFLESARFSKQSIRNTSRKLGLMSDSSLRYERGVDYKSIDLGRERALHLFYSLKAGKIVDYHPAVNLNKPLQKNIVTSANQISDLLGIKIKKYDIVKILKALDFNVNIQGEKLSVQVPLYREDIENFADIAEEVIRFYGYDKLNSTLMPTSHISAGKRSEESKMTDEIKQRLCSLGCFEIINFSFINEKAYDMLSVPSDNELRNLVRISNPLGEEQAVMRTQLVSSMLNTIALNQSRKNNNVRLFEQSKTFFASKEELPVEKEELVVGIYGDEEDFYTLKGIVESVLRIAGTEYILKRSEVAYLHPGMSADIISGGKILGHFGKIHPKAAKNFKVKNNVFVAEFYLSELFTVKKPVKYKELPKYPAVDRDLAFIVDDKITIGDLMEEIKLAGGALVTDVKLFDIFRGDIIPFGKYSAAFSLTLQSYEKTLTDEEISAVTDNIINSMKQKFNASLRDSK